MGLNVVMMGPPGAGKGTQASRFARERGVPKISTGDMLREGIKERNPVALEAKALMDQGRLVNDATMIAIVRDRLSRPDTAQGFVLDGFPRTVGQARELDALVTARGNGPLVVVDVTVPEAELVRRLATRRICLACGASPDPSSSAESPVRRVRRGPGAAHRRRRAGGVGALAGLRAVDAAGAGVLPEPVGRSGWWTARRRRTGWRATWGG